MMKKLNEFTTYDSFGRKYRIVEYETPDGPAYRTPDGYEVIRLDRTNFEIMKRNPKTGEPKIAVYR
jgi:hypothetical protein